MFNEERKATYIDNNNNQNLNLPVVGSRIFNQIEEFEKKYNRYNTFLVPVGSEIYPYCDNVPQGNVISYFGKMSYPPNAEAAVWFVNHVFKHS